MKIEPDSPLLTAYVLGELDDATRAAVEDALRESAPCRQAVEEIRQTTQWLSAELQTEPTVALSVEQRQAIEATLLRTDEEVPVTVPEEASIAPQDHYLTDPEPAPRDSMLAFWRRRITWVAAGVAACLALGLSLWQFQLPPRQPEPNAITNPADPDSAESLPQNDTAGPVAAAPADPQIAPESLPQAGGNLLSPAGVQPVETPVDALSTSPALAPKPNDSPEQSAPIHNMGPQLMKRYGLLPNYSRSQPASGQPHGPQPAPAAPPEKPTQYAMRPALTLEGPAAPNNRSLPGNPPNASLGEQLLRQQPKPTRSSVNELSDAARAQRYASKAPSSESRDRRRILTAPTLPPSTASYPHYIENDFLSVWDEPLSTFSIDVDTASYSNIRRFLNQGQLPPRDAVRLEEMINYFTYRYPQPKNGHPFSATLEVAGCPWNSEHRLIRIGLQGRQIARESRPSCNLVFLIDVSGSMQPAERLPLVKQALRMLAKRMTAADRIAIVVYADNSGIVLSSTSGADKEKILEAIDRLEAGGSTNGGAGIQQAYQLAAEHLDPEGVNRVILCTDGDFNVGITDHNALVNLIQEKAKNRIFLSALGVGTDNYKDDLLQKLANRGNGNYHYIDTLEEAEKVLVQQMNATLVAIAKDVKIQIEFNPAQVDAYRLIGYEKRVLDSEDFNDDRKDAGDIGAGHSVTALYEIIPAGRDEQRRTDALKYQPAPVREPTRPPANASRELLTLKIRYKLPNANESKLLEFTTTDTGITEHLASEDFKFASAVASFGMLLKDSRYKGNATWQTVVQLAQAGKSNDPEGYRAEFINLVHKAKSIRGEP